MFRAARLLLAAVVVIAPGTRLLAAPVACEEVYIHPVNLDPTTISLRIDTPEPGASWRRFTPACNTIDVTGVASTIGIPPHIDFYVVIDTSGSTTYCAGRDVNGDGTWCGRGDSILDAEIASARLLVDALDVGNSRMAIVRFSSPDSWSTQVVQELTSDRSALQAALSTIAGGGSDGSTCYGLAMEATLDEHAAHSDPGFEQVILFLSDGEPTDGWPAPRTGDCGGWSRDACDGILWSEEALARGLIVDTFAVGTGADPSVLAEMARRGGGRAFIVSTPGDIMAVLPRVSHVGVSRVIVTSTTTGDQQVVLPGPDGRFTATMAATPGVNGFDVTVVADEDDAWRVTCSTSALVTCLSHDCPAPLVLECPQRAEPLTAASDDPLVRISNDSPWDDTLPLGDADARGDYPLGLTRVTFTFEDDEAGSVTCSAEVRVLDTVAPWFTAVPDANVSAACTAVPPAPSLTAEDACDPAPRVTFAESRIDGDCPDRYELVRTWTATDASRRMTTAEQRVHVDDVIAPALEAAPAGVRIECDAPAPPLATLAAADDCDPEPLVERNEERIDGPCADTYRLVRTWIARDRCGNESAPAQQEIVVRDTKAPELAAAPAGLVLECDEPVPPLAPLAATDACDPAPLVEPAEQRIDGPCADTYRLVRTWIARDRCGNESAPEQQQIVVRDTKAPELAAAPPGLVLECDEPLPAPAAPAARDACDPDPAVTLDERTEPGPCPRTYTLTRTWTARDRCGNASEPLAQVIVVRDTHPPSLEAAPPDLIVECPQPVPAPAALAATDTCDPAPAVAFDEQRIAGPCPGTYRLVRTWTATDACGNAAAPEQQVIDVVDTTPPVIAASTAVVACVWPPDHRMTAFPLAVFAPVAHDACVDEVTWRITGCASDQPDDGRGDGRTAGDCVIEPGGGGVLVRAERDGARPEGRHYVVSAVATDRCGNTSAAAPIGTVRVPHDESGHEACVRPPGNGPKR